MKKNPKVEEYHFTIQASLFAVRILTLSSPPEQLIFGVFVLKWTCHIRCLEKKLQVDNRKM